MPLKITHWKDVAFFSSVKAAFQFAYFPPTPYALPLPFLPKHVLRPPFPSTSNLKLGHSRSSGRSNMIVIIHSIPPSTPPNPPIWVQVSNHPVEPILPPPIFRIGHQNFTFTFLAKIEGGRISVLQILQGTTSNAPIDWCVSKYVPNLQVAEMPGRDTRVLLLRYCSHSNTCPDNFPGGFSLWSDVGN